MNDAGLRPAKALLNNRVRRYKLRQMMMPDAQGGGRMLEVRRNVLQRVEGIDELIPDSVSNGSGKTGSGPGLDRKNGSVRFQTRPQTRPAASWRAKPRPVPGNPRVSTDLARPVGSNLRIRVSGFTFMVAFRYATVDCKIAPLVRYSPFRMYWPL